MSSFGATDFLIIGNGGQMPTVERDSDGFRHYRATIRIASLGDRNALAGMVSIVTPARIYGRVGGNLHLDGGSGAATLVVTATTGSTTSNSAVLVSLTNIRADGRGTQHRFTADAEWLLTS